MIPRAGQSYAERLDIVSDVTVYIVHNRPLEQLLFSRNIVGVEFKQRCLEASRAFVSHIADECRLEEAAELTILSKGLVYQLSEAVQREIGCSLAVNLMATSRVAVAHGTARVDVAYSQIEAPAKTLVIGDTVASGATIVAALRRYRESHALDRVYVLSYAGTLVGARKIAEYCRKNRICATFLFGLAAFGLAENGFDLSFLHPETITRESYRREAHRQFRGKPVSAIGWDFGSQVMAPQKYRKLCWLEAEIWGLHEFACLALAEEPADLRELSHERAAYIGELHRSGRLSQFT